MNEKPNVFLCYAKEDVDRVESLYERLKNEGCSPWMAEKDIPAGKKWKDEIMKNIRNSDYFLAFLSQNSINKIGMIQKEIKEALEVFKEKKPEDIFIIPLRLEDCEVPEELKHFQWLNLNDSTAWADLLKSLYEGRKESEQSVGSSKKKTYSINSIPNHICESYSTDFAILFCSEDFKGITQITTSLEPDDLIPVPDLDILEQIRRREGTHSITLVLEKLGTTMIRNATIGYYNRDKIISELDTLLKRKTNIYIVYAITHFRNKPFKELTIFIGGDGYRSNQLTLLSILDRTRDLSQAMMRKAVAMFPETPALHGGRKGEWIILDRTGGSIQDLSNEAIVALGSYIIPKGIIFLNNFKEDRAVERGLFPAFPNNDFIYPDIAGPDVLSTAYWEQMCLSWRRQGLDLKYFSCLPSRFNGRFSTSAKVVGYGIAATIIKLAESCFKNKKRKQLSFLLEALGKVGKYTIEALQKKYNVPSTNITAFDPDKKACKEAKQKYQILTFCNNHEDFYDHVLSSSYDIWVNNGLGDNTTPTMIQKLLDHDVKLFCGAANNIFEIKTRSKSLKRIFSSGAWAWPDEVANGGGFAMAVFDMYYRCQSQSSNIIIDEQKIFNTIVARLENIVKITVQNNGQTLSGEEIWERALDFIDRQADKSLQSEPLSDNDMLEMVNLKNWRLL